MRSRRRALRTTSAARDPTADNIRAKGNAPPCRGTKARGGAIESLEGNWTPHIIVIVEFPDLESARTWYRSPEYAATLAFRDAGLSRNLVLVDGVPQPL
jgi:Domain of unknown function (DUF1330)